MSGSALVTVLLDLVLIIVAARAFGRLAQRLGQPPVVGEITAGILAGPTVLGPQLSNTLFPVEARPTLSVLATLGVLAFMFIAGLEVERGVFTGARTTVTVISMAAYAVPFGLGCLVAIVALSRHHTRGAVSFALFIGCSLAVTAFPVLARILLDRDLIRTPIGQLSLACAAIVDVLAWIALAAVLILVAPGGDHWRWILLVPVAALGWWGLRPLLAGLAASATPQQVVVLALGSALAGGAFTEWVGLHVIFGGFAAGLLFPRAHRQVAEAGAGVLSALLLPAFFAVAGLSVDLGMIDLAGAGELAIITAAAVGAKIGSVMLAGRLTGLDTRTCAALAVLLNTRGLTELVVLHLGLTTGLIGSGLYSTLVVMALITTAMTEPLLRRIGLSVNNSGSADDAGRPHPTQEQATAR